MLTFSCNL